MTDMDTSDTLSSGTIRDRELSKLFQTGDRNPADSVPRPLIRKLAQICSNLEHSSRELHVLTKDLEELFLAVGVKTGIDYSSNLDRCLQIHLDLEDLIPRLQITSYTLIVNFYTWEEWEKVVEKGFILDVFSESGLKDLGLRIDKALEFLHESVDQINNSMGGDISPLSR